MASTADFAVKFGRHSDMGLEGQKSFPFVYSLINRNDDQWSPDSSLADNIVNGIGPIVKANSMVTRNVMLDPDYIFKLLSVRYTAYTVDAEASTCPWYENLQTDQCDGNDTDVMKVGTPLSRYIAITLSFTGGGAKIIYGGDDQGPVPAMLNGSRRVPLAVEAIQGYDYGALTVRTPYLLPPQACLVYEISNLHPSLDLVVGAYAYGMKLRL